MSAILGTRMWRPVLPLLVGVALGATLLAPVVARDTRPSTGTDAAITTTYTRSVSCAGLNWYPTDSETFYANDGPLRYSAGLGGTRVFRCDPGLPNKAVVTKVQFTLRDFDPGGQVHGCGLVRSGLTTATATSFQGLATVPATTDEGSEIVRLTDSSIKFDAIDNAKFGYWLECVIAGSNAYVGIYGADVIYTISSTNG